MSGDYSSTQQPVQEVADAQGQAEVKEATPPVPVAEEPLEDVAANELLASNPEAKSDSLTLTPDPSNFSMKHPLQARWTLWYDNPGKRVSSDHWEENVQKIMTFDTVRCAEQSAPFPAPHWATLPPSLPDASVCDER
jgi:hypothetical protein